MSCNPEGRLAALQRHNSQPLLILYFREVPYELRARIERRTYWLLRDGHIAGEWFDVSMSDGIHAIDRAVFDDGSSEIAKAFSGRPPLNTHPVNIRLLDDLVRRVDALVGAQRRSRFIREAIEEKLKREERKAAR